MAHAKEDWAEAKKRCRLNAEDIRMAKELGMTPRILIRNIPDKNSQWKAPVKFWVRELYEEKMAKRRKKDGLAGDLPGGLTKEDLFGSPAAGKTILPEGKLTSEQEWEFIQEYELI